MAMAIHPVDGLVRRLIRQGAAERHPAVRQGAPSGRDRVDLSREARQTGSDISSSKLESQLLQSYGPYQTGA